MRYNSVKTAKTDKTLRRHEAVAEIPSAFISRIETLCIHQKLKLYIAKIAMTHP